MENFAGPDRTTTTHVNFFPYRAARGGIPLTTPAGFGTMALYNNANSNSTCWYASGLGSRDPRVVGDSAT